MGSGNHVGGVPQPFSLSAFNRLASRHTFVSVSRILLQGKWLEAAGFEIGDHVVVEPSDERLVISKLTNEA